MYTCRECDEPVNQAAEICPYCGADLVEISFDLETGAPGKKSAKRIVILWAIVLLSLVAIAWFAFPWRLAGSKPEAETHAVAAITQLQQALVAYQAAAGDFPSSLETLGPRARDAFQEAESGRYTLQYNPGNPESNNRIKTYSLTARAGNYGYLNFFTDETDILRGTRENRMATVADPRVDPSSIRKR